MLDNDLIRIIGAILKDGFTASGWAVPVVKQNYQPTQQGANTAPTIYVHKMEPERRYGYRSNDTVYVPAVMGPPAVEGYMQTTEIQKYETSYQVDALVIQDPADVNSKTASDYINLAAAIMQAQTTVDKLTAAGIGILRVMEVRNPQFQDDRGRFEQGPSFDFTILHEQVILTTSPVAVGYEFDMERI